MKRLGLVAVTLGATLVSADALALDVVEQQVAVDLSAPDATTIDLELALLAEGPETSLTMFKPAVPIVEALLDGAPAVVEPHPGYPTQLVRVTFPTPLTPGETVTLQMTMSGTAACSAFCKRTAEETIFTAGAPGAAWYVNDPFDADPFVGTVTARVPDGQTVVTGLGAASTTPHGDGTTTWSFDVTHPLELIGLYAGTADVATAEAPFLVQGYHDPAAVDAALVQQGVDLLAELVPIYTSLYGDLPTDRVSLITVPASFPFGAMGMLANIYANAVVFQGDGYLVDQGMAHELAHTWWGNLTSGAGADSAFLGEGMAEYAGWRALGELRGDATRTAGMRMNATWYMYRRPDDADQAIIGVSQSSPVFIFVTYHKGAMALRALESAVGADAMDEALRHLVTLGPGQSSVAQLVQAIATTSSFDAGAWVEEWLERPGFPRLTVQTAASDDTVTLNVTLDDPWTLHLPVQLRFADGSTEDRLITVDALASEHALPVDRRPAAVVVDPAWTMAREITPAVAGDVTLDGTVDGADLLEVALAQGRYLPTTRRVDGGYDPLFDVARDGVIDRQDLDAVVTAAASTP